MFCQKQNFIREKEHLKQRAKELRRIITIHWDCISINDVTHIISSIIPTDQFETGQKDPSPLLTAFRF